MSISTKTALPILAMAVLLSLSAFFIQRHLILPAFTDIETRQAQDHIDRAIRRLEAELRTVDFTVYDWSSWDDTYRFAADQNEEFVRSNLNADTFENYGFEVALLMDLEGTPLWAGVYDFQAEEGNVDQTGHYLAGLLATAIDLSQRIDLSADVDDQRTRGTLDLKGTPVLFSMRPIHRSDGSGDPRGFVLFGQALSAQFVEALSEEIVMDFTLNAFAQRPTETDARQSQGPYQIDAISTEHLRVSRALTETDPLTGLFNRLALDKKLHQAWDILSRTGDPLSLLLLDIDHFKAYNDGYGHQAGDECLQTIANLLQAGAKRDADMVARYGGEEFLIVLPGTPVEDAEALAEKLRQSGVVSGKGGGPQSSRLRADPPG